MAQNDHKVNIFQLLGSLSKKKVSGYSNLTDDEKKTVQPLVIMRWLTGTTNARQIYFLNELVNPFVFTLSKHKDLLMNLISICGSGSSERYKWVKSSRQKTINMPEAVSVIKERFGYNTTDAIDALTILTVDDVISYADDLGRQSNEIQKIKKEFKARGK